jgi:crotonobetainyl-CoA:carnitine CoA-transferase CaiB-like acyl-CoA transferase
VGGAVKRLPFEGVRVVDLSMMWAGPFATKLLGEAGAEVLKIESPTAWDNIRTLIPQPGRADPWNSSYYFNTYNRAKKSVTLDLSRERGRAVLLELLPHCDVFLENYRADVLDRLGLGYDVLLEANPAMIVVSMAGFGKTGPDRALVGFGPVIEQMSGLAALTGYAGDDVPYKCGVSYGDPVAGIAAAGAVAMGLLQRRRPGRGMVIDLAQREVAATLAGSAFVAASRDPQVVHHGNRHPRGAVAPRGCYRCADEARPDRVTGYNLLPARDVDEQWIAVSVLDDEQWRALAALIGRDDWATLPLGDRVARHDELDAAIAAWCAGRDAEETVATLRDHGIAASRVLDSVAVHDDPHLRARRFWIDLPHPRMPEGWKQPGIAWRSIPAGERALRPAPMFGEHTAEVLSTLLGYDDATLAELAADGITGDAPVNPGVG